MKIRHFLALFLVIGAVATTSAYNHYWQQRASIHESLPISSRDIVMLGDSQTDIPELTELFGDLRVKNRGISGDGTQGVIDRLPPILKGKPAKIFLRVGVNDLAGKKTAKQVAANILRIVDLIHQGSPRTRVYVLSCLPINQKKGTFRTLDGQEQAIRDINKTVSAQAKKKNFTWLNDAPLYTDAQGNLDMRYSNDGLHLMGPAYLKFRDFLRPYINQ